MILIKVFRYQSKLKYMVNMKTLIADILTLISKLDHFRVTKKKVLYYENGRKFNPFFFLRVAFGCKTFYSPSLIDEKSKPAFFILV